MAKKANVLTSKQDAPKWSHRLCPMAACLLQTDLPRRKNKQKKARGASGRRGRGGVHQHQVRAHGQAPGVLVVELAKPAGSLSCLNRRMGKEKGDQPLDRLPATCVGENTRLIRLRGSIEMKNGYGSKLSLQGNWTAAFSPCFLLQGQPILGLPYF